MSLSTMTPSVGTAPAVDAWQGSLFAFDDPTVDPLLLGVERVLPEPRLTAWWAEAAGGAEPLPVLGESRAALGRHYTRPFDTIGFNLYRDGRDSVAWHGDRERHLHDDPVVAIVSVGAPRAFLLRPRGGGPSRGWHVGRGDLLVMGGRCQHDWEHCVPKVTGPTGPRLSIMFRHHLAAEPAP